MTLERKLYIANWLEFLGLQREYVAAKAGITPTQMSRIAGNRLKGPPRQGTLEAIAGVIKERVPNFRVHDFWTDPFEVPPPEVPVAADASFDLEAWLNDPLATIHGKPATEAQRALVREMVAFLKAGGGL